MSLIMKSEKGRGRTTKLWLIVVSVGLIHLLCYKAAQPLRHSHHSSLLSKRSLSSLDDSPPQFEDSAALIDYQYLYHNASPQAKPFIFALMIVWLVFLFAFVGITASDFFCPNLSTIASRLGLSESVAGVTFLAFSNGSPDVFSTFAALKSHSGSLAIGELLGAASFIVSVVAGTMCVIQPFKVSRHTFLRDVGFFTIAVSSTLGILWDSHIHGWEALGMVGLYCIYVAVVAVQSWWYARKERKEKRIQAARNEYATEVGEEYRDDPLSPHYTPSSSLSTSRAHSIVPSQPSSGLISPSSEHTHFPFPSPGPSHPHQHQELTPDTLFTLTERGTPVTLSRTRSASTATAQSPLARRPKTRSNARPSLLGAIEFRDVVNSLRADSSARTLAVFGGREDHSHATLIGPDIPGSSSSSTKGMRGRAASHTGGRRPSEGEATAAVPSPSVSKHARRASWAAQSEGALSTDDPGHWSEFGEDEESGLPANGEGPLIDLSPGVENPWQGSVGRESLKIDIPSRLRSSASSPRNLKKRNSEISLDEAGHTIRKVPSIMLTTAGGAESRVLVDPPPPKKSRFAFTHRKGYRITRAVFLALFPSLQDFGQKSWVGKATAILCVPAILMLNLTLPVVDAEEDDCASVEAKEYLENAGDGGYRDEEEEDWDVEEGPREGHLVDVEDEHHHGHYRPPRSPAQVAREHVAHEFHSHVTPHPSPWAEDGEGNDSRVSDATVRLEGGEEDPIWTQSPHPMTVAVGSKEYRIEDHVVHEDVLTRWLTVVQCVLAPTFCVTAAFADQLAWWYPLAGAGVGIIMAIFAYWCFEDHRHPGRISLCFVGFFVAGMWILLIVNEVVGVLQTFGHIFGLSDAILGLTIFAMGNSLGDLVANATVARMGYPSMAIAACFGGPMLNILLGVGLSGTYMIYYDQKGAPYHVDIGRTLIVSGLGLLVILVSTLFIVPMNDYWMSKRLGWTLICAYCLILCINIGTEIWLLEKSHNRNIRKQNNVLSFPFYDPAPRNYRTMRTRNSNN